MCVWRRPLAALAGEAAVGGRAGGVRPAQKSINAMMVTAPNATLAVSGGGRPKMAEGEREGKRMEMWRGLKSNRGRSSNMLGPLVIGPYADMHPI